MHEPQWHWPQTIYAIAIVIALVGLSVQFVRDQRLSSSQVTLRILALAAYEGFFVWVLHKGGFW